MTTTQDDISDEQLLSALKKAIADFPPRHSEAEALNVMEYSLALELRKARAVAALAREGWRPIPNDEGAAISLFEPRSNPCPLVPSAEAEAQLQEPAPMTKKDSWSHGFDVKRLANRLDELADYVTQGPECVRRNFVMQVPVDSYHDAGMVLSIAASLLRDWLASPKGATPVLASERPWEREGWLHPKGQWCWHWNRGAAGWDHRSLVNGVEDDTLLLPHWAIPDPSTPAAS